MKPAKMKQLKVVIIGTMLTLGAATKVARATTWYVDDSQGAVPPTADGTTWNKSFRYLQEALAMAISGDTIRVATGVYHPDDTYANPDSGDQTASFVMKPGVIIRGSYGGLTAVNPDDWNPDLFPTVLSGDLEDNDDPNLGLSQTNRLLNTYNVVTGGTSANPIDQFAVLDGFIIPRRP